jgi:hypothetical protein
MAVTSGSGTRRLPLLHQAVEVEAVCEPKAALRGQATITCVMKPNTHKSAIRAI